MISIELEWTTTHGHFVQMGGLEGIHPDGRREIIDPRHLVNYLEQGEVHLKELQFPKNQVQDRSKGDFLSKGLVALQTSWFVLECIARFQQHLPITELEVVTLAFAVLNIITYGFWWDKPLNVNCQVPIHIKPKVSSDVAETNGSRDESGNKAEGEGRPVPEAGTTGGVKDNDGTVGGDNQEGDPMLMTPIGQDKGDVDASTTKNGRNQKKSLSVGQHLLRFPRQAYDRLVVRPFTALVIPIQDMFRCDKIEEGTCHVPMFYGVAVNWGTLLRIRLMSCLIGIIFAAIHFLAWNSHFPTHVELLLWRSSSLIVLVIPFFIGLLGIFLRDWDFETSSQSQWEGYRRDGHPVRTAILSPIRWPWTLYVLGPILYILARVSFIIQAFISLRDLEPTVFQNVKWTSYIPHL